MSHIATVEMKIKDMKVLKKVCEQLGLSTKQVKDYVFYDNTKASGLSIQLNNWRYPIVVKDDGSIVFDNYNGSWGKVEHLQQLQQAYSTEIAKQQLRKQGYMVKETKLANGKVELLVSK